MAKKVKIVKLLVMNKTGEVLGVDKNDVLYKYDHKEKRWKCLNVVVFNLAKKE